MALNPRRIIIALFALVLAIGAPLIAFAQSFTPEQRGEIEKIIREYLMRNPELLQEVIGSMHGRTDNVLRREDRRKLRNRVTA